jgi:alpha-mannosidase
MDFQTIIDWQERHKLLKVNFPVDYRAREALHEIQFGHITRPTHRSREIDRDRFEVSNHKWTALAEPDRGFAILNDSKYGVDVLDNSINLTLLKSPLAPDMTADRGQQAFTYAFYFWNGPFFESGLVQQAYQLNIPLRMVEGYAESQSLFRIDQPNVILETVKPAEDSTSGDIILRLYESMGNKTQTRLTSSLPITRVFQTDMLENINEECHWTEKGLELVFRPFEIKTLRLVMR